MQTHLSHIQFNVRPENISFYKDLLAFLGWPPLYDTAEMLGVAGKGGASLWFIGQFKDVSTDYDAPGMNHLAIGAESTADVDATAAYLRERGVDLLFDTPRHRPEFAGKAEETYYQVMFESPDRILWEVVYMGPHPA